MKTKRQILFYGELPPNAIHGIANASSVNLKMLESSFYIDTIEEKNKFTEHNKISFHKFLEYFKNNFGILLKSIFHRYDYFYLIFSLTTFGSIKTLSALFSFCLFNRGSVVLHIHRGDFFSRFYKAKLNRILSKMIFAFSDKIIVLSENQKIEFESVFKKSFCILHNTVEAELNVEHRIRQTRSFIYISNYLYDKGIIDLLEVFSNIVKENDKISLQTFGAFSDQQLKELVLEFNSPNIVINDIISGLDKFEKIAESDCLILPSWNEGQPIILLEAMSVGTPVIATSVGLIPELLGTDYPYLSIPKDKISLENTLLKFIRQNNADAISKKLKSRYFNHYSLKIHFISLQNIFN